MPPQSRLSGRAFWGLASWALPLAIIFVVSPKLLHLLGADRFGVLMIALVTPLIAAQLDFGVCAAGVRRIAAQAAEGQVDGGGTLFTLFVILATIGAVCGLALWLAARSIAEWVGFASALGASEGTRLARACALWFGVSLTLLLPGIVARALQRFALIASLQTVGTLLLWLAALALLRAGHTLEDLVRLATGLTVASSLVTVAAVRGKIDWQHRRRLEWRLVRGDWRFSAWMFAAQAAGAIVYQADRILVSALGTPAMAGLYAICASVANKTAAAVASLTAFVFPHAAYLASSEQGEAIGGLLHALNRAIAVLVVPVLLPAVWLAAPFLVLWIGAYATSEVIDAFRVLVVAFAVPAFAVPVSSILAGTGNATLPARFAWLTVCVIVLGLVLLVPSLGLVGAALAMLLANATSLVFVAVGRHALGVPLERGALPFWAGIGLGVAAQGAMLAMLADRADSWGTLVAVGIAAWGVFYIARVIFGALSPEERDLLQRALARLHADLPR